MVRKPQQQRGGNFKGKNINEVNPPKHKRVELSVPVWLWVCLHRWFWIMTHRNVHRGYARHQL
jgi:hypothetical protein